MIPANAKMLLSPWVLDRRAQSLLESEFDLALEACDFRDPEGSKARMSAGHAKPGVYFWVVRAWGRRHRLYIGQTTSLSYRLGNYLSPFQPNATNDFKLRVCHDLIVEAHRAARFDLYFQPLAGVRKDSPRRRAVLREAEKRTLAAFGGAFVNERGQASDGAKARLRAAYEDFYRENLLSILNRPTVR